MKILIAVLSLTIVGCATTNRGQQKPIESNFGDSDVKFKKFSQTFGEVKTMNITTEEKMRIILEKAKELEGME